MEKWAKAMNTKKDAMKDGMRFALAAQKAERESATADAGFAIVEKLVRRHFWNVQEFLLLYRLRRKEKKGGIRCMSVCLCFGILGSCEKTTGLISTTLCTLVGIHGFITHGSVKSVVLHFVA